MARAVKNVAAVRTVHHEDFDAEALARAKGDRRLSVCLPARDEATTVGEIVQTIRKELVERCGLVDEILVVDDNSRDGTAAVAEAAGARVVRSSGRGGKGGALQDAVAAAEGDVLVFCDADLRDFDPRFVVGLAGPLLTSDDVRFVKAFYERTLDGSPRGGGRVTELTARPLLAVLFPELSPMVQPLAGEFAAPASVLRSLPFVEGYGVDIGLLIDVADRYGADTIAQVDLGRRVHRNRPLDELAPMATVIVQTVLARARIEVPTDVALEIPRRGSVPVTYRERPPLG